MKLIAAVLLIIGGLMLLSTAALVVGVLMIAAGCWVFTKVSGREEDTFTGALVILGAAGAAYPFLDFAWTRITALLP